MSNYYELILDTLNESGKTIKDLEDNGIIAKNTFYIFKHNAPSLISMIKIANFLNTSIDYILNRVDINKFKKYSLTQSKFYANLKKMMLSTSQTKLCKDLGISRTNFSRWSTGTKPTLSKIIAIANYLNCNIDELLEIE
ncbi:MAG: helix-turn-helix transcriptional regulator [Clostridia bacterium]|nr:helix-turn-helix transcriptional regulator [Clostridia bacterium]